MNFKFKKNTEKPKKVAKAKKAPKPKKPPGPVRIFWNKYLNHSLILSLVLSFVLNIAIESMARGSISQGFLFLKEEPLVFLCNMFIIFATMSIALLVRRRTFTFLIISTLWLTLGITNGVILTNRMTPFTIKDIAVLEDGISIVTNYMSFPQITMLVVGVIILIAFLILLFIFAPKRKEKINFKVNLVVFVLVWAGLFGSLNVAINSKVLDTFFGNLAYAYRDNGVPYCFMNTWLNTGVKKPSKYTKEAMLGIFDEKELGKNGYAEVKVEDDGKKNPNILMLQLESFMDPKQVKGLRMTQDPIPNFRAMKEEFSSGYLTVPSVGAGTANTEFEVLCGMSVKFFGPGEYPYKTVLADNTCESLAYSLKNIGYGTHAIHNHRGAFYGRNIVFKNLGFDTFTSIEYMNYAARTAKNWAKDAVLTDQIVAALDSTEKEDFIYTISVQGHGKYPSEKVLENAKIKVSGLGTYMNWQYEYYVNQLREMDLFIKNLTDTLSNYDEDIILVMYGDHLPALEMTAEDMTTNSLYKTEYVVWSNYDRSEEDKDLKTFQLAAEVLGSLGMDNGVMTKYHQNHKDSKTYTRDLKALQYDMLYGEHFVFGGIDPYEPTDMKMGVKPIEVKEIVKIGKKFYIKGQNFTEYSKISIGDRILKTIYLGPTVIGLLEEVDPEDASKMKVSQVESKNEILSTTE